MAYDKRRGEAYAACWHNISKLIADAARGIVQAEDHETDADCAMFLINDTCTECGVYHGDPCPGCGGRGYHMAGCL